MKVGILDRSLSVIIICIFFGAHGLGTIYCYSIDLFAKALANQIRVNVLSKFTVGERVNKENFQTES